MIGRRIPQSFIPLTIIPLPEGSFLFAFPL